MNGAKHHGERQCAPAATAHCIPAPFLSRAFGLVWESDTPLREFGPALPDDHEPDVLVRRTEYVAARPGGRRINNGEIFDDGARFRFGEACFDTFGDTVVNWTSGADDMVPAALYGTVTAIILAWRGLVPLHGSAVAFGERAMIVAGPPGAGKSTLCAALVRCGGRLVSDDLSALRPMSANGTPMLEPGRPAVRLIGPRSTAHDDKVLHAMPMVDRSKPVALSAMVVLGGGTIDTGPVAAADALRRQLFRPTWMKALPNARERAVTLLHAAQRMAMLTAPSARERPDWSADEKAAHVLARLEAVGALR